MARTCEICGGPIELWEIRCRGEMLIEDMRCNIGRGEMTISSSQSSVCLKCALKAIGNGVIRSGRVEVDETWRGEEVTQAKEGDEDPS